LLAADARAAVVARRVRRAAAVAEIVARVALGHARVAAVLPVRAVRRHRIGAGADAGVRGIGRAHHQAGAGDGADLRGVAAAAVGVLLAQVALDVAARRRLADVRARRAERRAQRRAAAGAARARRAVDGAGGGGERGAGAGARARRDGAHRRAAVGRLEADVADLRAVGDLRRRG